jgi:hypothetical protein
VNEPIANQQKPPMSEREKIKRENGHKLWRVEIIFNDPEEPAIIRKYDYVNLLHVEFRELRSSLFLEGLLYPVDPVRWCVVPPAMIRNIYAFRQKKYIE